MNILNPNGMMAKMTAKNAKEIISTVSGISLIPKYLRPKFINEIKVTNIIEKKRFFMKLGRNALTNPGFRIIALSW